MKFRLFRRRLTISSPRMSVRSGLPWPVRWMLGAIVLGFSAAIALWAFEFGKGIAGLDSDAKDELKMLRAEVAPPFFLARPSQLSAGSPMYWQ